MASRIWVAWGIVNLVPEETTQGALQQLGPLSPTFTSLVTAWCLSEIIRYGFFAAKVRPGTETPAHNENLCRRGLALASPQVCCNSTVCRADRRALCPNLCIMLQALGLDAHILLWLRYSAFLVLYPVGVGSELTMAALALSQVNVIICSCCHPACRPASSYGPSFPSCIAAQGLTQHNTSFSDMRSANLQIRRRKLLSLELPNGLNWAFDYYTACIILMLVYLPGECPVECFCLAGWHNETYCRYHASSTSVMLSVGRTV